MGKSRPLSAPGTPRLMEKHSPVPRATEGERQRYSLLGAPYWC